MIKFAKNYYFIKFQCRIIFNYKFNIFLNVTLNWNISYLGLRKTLSCSKLQPHFSCTIKTYHKTHQLFLHNCINTWHNIFFNKLIVYKNEIKFWLVCSKIEKILTYSVHTQYVYSTHVYICTYNIHILIVLVRLTKKQDKKRDERSL